MPDTDHRVSDSDALLWTIEVDPLLRSTIVVVGVLDHEPDTERVRATFGHGVTLLPRLGQRIASRAGRLQWVAADVDLEYHVRRVRAPSPGGLRAVLDIAQPLAAAGFDRARPLWEVLLVEGVGGGRSAFVLRMHHSVTDGVGGVALAGLLLDPERHTGANPVIGPTEPSGRRDGLARLASSVVDGGWKRGAWHRTSSDRSAETLSDTLHLARSTARLLAPASGPCSPLLQGRSLARHLDIFDVGLDDLRTTGHTLGATVNEVYLAGLVAGLAQYHDKHGVRLERLRFTMPVNIRSADDPLAGNRFVPTRFVFPIESNDPLHLVREASRIVRRTRSEPSLHLTGVLSAGLRRLPPTWSARVFGGMLKGVDIDFVDVPGLQKPAYLGGARLVRLYAFAPPAGAAMSITLLSHVETACIGVESDRACVPDPDLLSTCLIEGLDQVRSLRHGVPQTVS